MNDSQTKTLKFTKTANGETHECEIRCFDDGSVGVFGEDIGTAIFEFTKDALENAIEHVNENGYEPVNKVS